MSRALVADIGATSARFGLGGRGGVARHVEFATRDFSCAADLLAAATDALEAGGLDSACLAVAGPAIGGRAAVTKHPELQFDAAQLQALLGCPVQVVNDFHALAMMAPAAEPLRQVGGGAGDDGVRAVIGPGSGLGMAGLIPQDGGWRPVASEGGHADLAPGSPLEQELLAVLQRRHGHVCWETVVSGPGLARLHQAVAELWGTPAEALSPARISALGASVEDPLCHQTLEIFFALLGSAAGNLALTFCATGGLYIGGGIIPQLADFASTSPLRRRFEERGELSGYVEPIPIHLMLDPLSGLKGALRCALAAAPSA
ncbi:MAG: ROK family protein [Gammaproteobacteria bacterium]|nr:ROK family protein [Gammaproteobacteria bacterium]MCY4343768.1 ROK family protein [Gammaproteobacteria bacterium]